MSKEKTIKESSKLYELGFHIVGTIDSNKVAGVVDEIKNLIQTHHGDIVSEGEVREITLAYTIVKHIAGVNKKYNQSFFDWIKFNMSAEDVAKLKVAIDSNEKIIRYLLIKTVNDYDHSTNKLADLEKENEQSEQRDSEEKEIDLKVESEVVEKKSEKEKEIDQAIEEIIK